MAQVMVQLSRSSSRDKIHQPFATAKKGVRMHDLYSFALFLDENSGELNRFQKLSLYFYIPPIQNLFLYILRQFFMIRSFEEQRS